MKYLHKFKAEDKTVYVVSDSAQKPSTLTVRQREWEGRAIGGQTSTVMKQINGLSFSKEEKMDKEEMKAKKASIAAELDIIASDLEAQGQLDIAKAIDLVSDFMDSTKE